MICDRREGYAQQDKLFLATSERMDEQMARASSHVPEAVGRHLRADAHRGALLCNSVPL